MCLTANSIRECVGSICQIVGFSTWGAVVAVIAVPLKWAKTWAGQSGPWCCQAQVRPQTDISGGLALLSVLLPRAVPPHSGPGRVVRAGVARRGRVPHAGALESVRSASDGADSLIVHHILYFVKCYPKYNCI